MTEYPRANAVGHALLWTLFTWGVTALGAALVFVLPHDRRRQQAMLTTMLGFAAGVMTAASFWSLLAPALELAAAQGYRQPAAPVAVGFVLGCAGIVGADAALARIGVSGEPLELMQAHEAKAAGARGGALSPGAGSPGTPPPRARTPSPARSCA